MIRLGDDFERFAARNAERNAVVRLRPGRPLRRHINTGSAIGCGLIAGPGVLALIVGVVAVFNAAF